MDEAFTAEMASGLKIRTTSGTARKNSTIAVAGRLTQLWSDNRPAANTAPNTIESTAASANACSVASSACSSVIWMTL